MQKKLLPVGFYDLIFDEAEKNHKNINLVLDFFLNSGYRLIKTPLVEFEGNFSASEAENSFMAVDVISKKGLVFRSDITPQISRLIGTRLSQENRPLKLCYVGDVLCMKSEDLYADRQQTQVGIEVIGCEEEHELVVVEDLLFALEKLTNEELLIEFSLPGFLAIFLNEIGVIENSCLREAVMKKNLSAIKSLAKEHAEIIGRIAISNDDLEGLIKEILLKTKSSSVKNWLDRAQRISGFVQKKFSKVKTRFDLFGDHESSYHSGISFDVFCGNFSYSVARGGRYKIENIDAVGATIYMNRLRQHRSKFSSGVTATSFA